jgi:putative nucleotidyltransferase with HDIG domain
VRILYRIRQFWRSFSAQTSLLELERAQARLNQEQRELFARLQPGEKGHSLVMFRRLLEQGENQPDLLVAALLHDIGKLRYRLSPLERAMVVLVKAVNPGQARHWGNLPPNGWDNLPGWRKAFIVAEQHAGWGAEMARKSGVSPLTETLIREHHHPHRHEAGAVENSLLRKLWVVDNES